MVSRPVECQGHEPLLVEFPDVCTVSYVPDLRHHQTTNKRRGENTPPLVILNTNCLENRCKHPMCYSRENGNPERKTWIPASAGMTN
jgi:hypothetical protein